MAPSLHVGGIAYFRWKDPPENPERPARGIDVELVESDYQYHYRPVLELIAAR